MNKETERLARKQIAERLELVIRGFILEGAEAPEEKATLHMACRELVELRKEIPLPEYPLPAGIHLLTTCCFMELANEPEKITPYLKVTPWPDMFLNPAVDFREAYFALVVESWLQVMLSLKDSFMRQKLLLRLETIQRKYLTQYFDSLPDQNLKAGTMEFACLLLLANCTEILRQNPEDIERLENTFLSILELCREAKLVEVEPLARLLQATVRHSKGLKLRKDN
jgi:hypothetical protein